MSEEEIEKIIDFILVTDNYIQQVSINRIKRELLKALVGRVPAKDFKCGQDEAMIRLFLMSTVKENKLYREVLEKIDTLSDIDFDIKIIRQMAKDALEPKQEKNV